MSFVDPDPKPTSRRGPNPLWLRGIASSAAPIRCQVTSHPQKGTGKLAHSLSREPMVAQEPITIFAHILDPAGVARLLREQAATAKADGPDDSWANAVVTFDDGTSKRTLTFKHNPEYYGGPGWSQQKAGMRRYFSRFPDSPRKQQVMLLTSSFRFSIGSIFEPDFAPDGDERLDLLFKVAQLLDGVLFTPSSLRDAHGRTLFSSGGEENEDPEAEWPRVRGEVSVSTPAGAAMHDISRPKPPNEAQDNDDPPTAEIEEVLQARSKGEFDLKAAEKVACENPYFAYTKQFDEVVSARDLGSNEEIRWLFSHLLGHIGHIGKQHKQIAEEVSDVLAARSPVSLSVTLLLDNSGSLRGRQITYLAATALSVAEWLEKWDIPCEVLGYTTAAWKGGRSRELWLADGKKLYPPGRLNDLRHIVYKTFDETVLVASTSFGIMMKEGVLRENIDGEALLWAYSRLRVHSSEKKLLVVMTDGAPVDDSTLSVNPGGILEKHLSRTVLALEKSGLDVVAIGVGHDPRKSYSTAVQVVDFDQLGVAMFR